MRLPPVRFNLANASPLWFSLADASSSTLSCLYLLPCPLLDLCKQFDTNSGLCNLILPHSCADLDLRNYELLLCASSHSYGSPFPGNDQNLSHRLQQLQIVFTLVVENRKNEACFGF
jgi:hypothetical protein